VRLREFILLFVVFVIGNVLSLEVDCSLPIPVVEILKLRLRRKKKRGCKPGEETIFMSVQIPTDDPAVDVRISHQGGLSVVTRDLGTDRSMAEIFLLFESSETNRIF
jgi:hypothetical protein